MFEGKGLFISDSSSKGYLAINSVFSEFLNKATPLSFVFIDDKVLFIVSISIRAVSTPINSLFSSLIARSCASEFLPVVRETITLEKLFIKSLLSLNI